MKKLLAIIVLGLLFEGCASKEQIQSQQTNYKKVYDIVMLNAEKNLVSLSKRGIDMIIVNYSMFTGIDEVSAINKCGQVGKFYFIFAETTHYEKLRTGRSSSGRVTFCSRKKLTSDPIYGNAKVTYYTHGASKGKYAYWYENSLSKTNYDEVRKNTLANTKIKLVEANKNLLINLKSTCKEFGYKEGTEKFADCMKELYVKQTTPVNNTIIQTNTGSPKKTKRKIDPTVWKDLDNISQGILRDGKSIGEALRDVNK